MSGTCPRCDAPLREGASFCGQCGVDLDRVTAEAAAAGQDPYDYLYADPPDATVPVPVQPTPEREPAPAVDERAVKERAPIGGVALIVVAALLLVGGLIAGGWMLLGSSGDDDSELAVESPVASESPTAEDSPTPTEEASPSKQPKPEKNATCWNGKRKVGLDRCPEPTGVAGLGWVFPSAQPEDCEQKTVDNPRRPTFIVCKPELPGGGNIRIHYSEWSDVASSIASYESQNIVDERRWAYGTEWLINAEQGGLRFKAARAYEDAPFSVTLYASSDTDRRRALAELLSTRPADSLRGETD